MREEIIGNARLILGDCREILPTLARVDAVVTDPPYGIGKAEWDDEFSMAWADLIHADTRIAAIMPGVWNLTCMPQRIGGLSYKWVLSAHLINGMTMGGMGWGNWIPCVIYDRKIPRKSSDIPDDWREWCSNFAEWLDSNKIKTSQLNDACGTKSMAGRWRERTWSQIPKPSHWRIIKETFGAPDWLDPPGWNKKTSDYTPQTDCKQFVVGGYDKPDHPSPKPLNVTKWFVDAIGPQSVLDPFMGSGTTGAACAMSSLPFVGIEREPKYFDIALRRIEAAQRQNDLFMPSVPQPEARTPDMFAEIAE